MIEQLQQTMGVRVFMFTGYRDEKGQLMKTWFVLLPSFPQTANATSTGMSLTQGMGKNSPQLTLIGKAGHMSCLAIM